MAKRKRLEVEPKSPRDSPFGRPSLPAKRLGFEEDVIEEEDESSPQRPIEGPKAFAFQAHRHKECSPSGKCDASDQTPKDSDFYRDAEVILTEK